MKEVNTYREGECCDLCGVSRVEDIITQRGTELRRMFRMDDGCIVCGKCLLELGEKKYNEG